MKGTPGMSQGPRDHSSSSVATAMAIESERVFL